MGAGGVTVKVTGADFGAVARALRAADPKLRADMSADIRRITGPIVQDLRASVQGTSASSTGSQGWGSAQRALKALSRGKLSQRRIDREVGRAGLRASIARALRAYQRDRGASVGVRIAVNTANLPEDQRRLPRHMDRGQWRHPVFGNRNAWVSQTVTPEGWFTTVAQQHRMDAYEAINRTVHHHAQRLARRIDAAG